MVSHEHEYYEELCAAASLGEGSSQDLVELQEHMIDCHRCRQAYSDYLSIAAHEFAASEKSPALSGVEAQQVLNSKLLISRFFARSRREGIVFSEEVFEKKQVNVVEPPSLMRHSRWNWLLPLNERSTAIAISAAVLAIFGISVYRANLQNHSEPALQNEPHHTVAIPAGEPLLPYVKDVSSLAQTNRQLTAEIGSLEAKLTAANAQLNANEADWKATLQDRKTFILDREALKTQLIQVQQELAKWQALATDAQLKAEAAGKQTKELEATLAADQDELAETHRRLEEESGALARERQLLSMGRDVSDLMGARNLHILDVVDTDARGKSRPAFGRIFYTEGKSLVFYAYDLNEAKIKSADYQYVVWAKKEGQNRTPQRLGIFYSDDKAQNRWVFKCEDANVVREIDSVFVTLGRPNGDPTHPQGSNLMYAYLHGPPNHP